LRGVWVGRSWGESRAPRGPPPNPPLAGGEPCCAREVRNGDGDGNVDGNTNATNNSNNTNNNECSIPRNQQPAQRDVSAMCFALTSKCLPKTSQGAQHQFPPCEGGVRGGLERLWKWLPQSTQRPRIARCMGGSVVGGKVVRRAAPPPNPPLAGGEPCCARGVKNGDGDGNTTADCTQGSMEASTATPAASPQTPPPATTTSPLLQSSATPFSVTSVPLVTDHPVTCSPFHTLIRRRYEAARSSPGGPRTADVRFL